MPTYTSFYHYYETHSKANKGGRNASEEAAYIKEGDEKDDKKEQGEAISKNGDSQDKDLNSALGQAIYIEGEKRRPDLVGNVITGNLPAWADGDYRKFFEMSQKYEDPGHTTYREVTFALPNAITIEDCYKIIQCHLHETGIDRLTFAYAIHDKKAGLSLDDTDRNRHVHIMFSDRMPDEHARTPEKYFSGNYNYKKPERGPCRKDPKWGERNHHTKLYRYMLQRNINDMFKQYGIKEYVFAGTKKELYDFAQKHSDELGMELSLIPAQKHMSERHKYKDNSKMQETIARKQEAQIVKDKHNIRRDERTEAEISLTFNNVRTTIQELRGEIFSDQKPNTEDYKAVSDAAVLQKEIAFHTKNISSDTALAAIKEFAKENNLQKQYLDFYNSSKTIDKYKQRLAGIERQNRKKDITEQDKVEQQKTVASYEREIVRLEPIVKQFEETVIKPNKTKIDRLEKEVVIPRNNGNKNKAAEAKNRIEEIIKNTPNYRELEFDIKWQSLDKSLIEAQKQVDELRMEIEQKRAENPEDAEKLSARLEEKITLIESINRDIDNTTTMINAANKAEPEKENTTDATTKTSQEKDPNIKSDREIEQEISKKIDAISDADAKTLLKNAVKFDTSATDVLADIDQQIEARLRYVAKEEDIYGRALQRWAKDNGRETEINQYQKHQRNLAYQQIERERWLELGKSTKKSDDSIRESQSIVSYVEELVITLNQKEITVYAKKVRDNNARNEKEIARLQAERQEYLNTLLTKSQADMTAIEEERKTLAETGQLTSDWERDLTDREMQVAMNELGIVKNTNTIERDETVDVEQIDLNTVVNKSNAVEIRTTFKEVKALLDEHIRSLHREQNRIENEKKELDKIYISPEKAYDKAKDELTGGAFTQIETDKKALEAARKELSKLDNEYRAAFYKWNTEELPEPPGFFADKTDYNDALERHNAEKIRLDNLQKEIQSRQSDLDLKDKSLDVKLQRLEDFCTKPDSKVKIDGMAQRILNSNRDVKERRDNLVRQSSSIGKQAKKLEKVQRNVQIILRDAKGKAVPAIVRGTPPSNSGGGGGGNSFGLEDLLKAFVPEFGGGCASLHMPEVQGYDNIFDVDLSILTEEQVKELMKKRARALAL